MNTSVKQIGAGTFIGLGMITPISGHQPIFQSNIQWKPLYRVVYKSDADLNDYGFEGDPYSGDITINSFKSVRPIEVKVLNRGSQKTYPLEEYNHVQEV